MVRAQSQRLQAIFKRALAVASAPALLIACTTDDVTTAPTVDSSVPLTDAGHGDDGGEDNDTDVIAHPPAESGTGDGSAIRDAALDVTACWTNVIINDAGPDVEENCVYTFPCGMPPGYTSDDGCAVRTIDPNGVLPEGGALPCRLVEGDGCMLDAYAPGPNGSIAMSCYGCPANGSGRAPRGLARMRGGRATDPRRALGAYFGRAAYLERASVDAFAILAGDLRALDAPAALIAKATRSATDETRHARVTARLARVHGGRVETPRIARRGAPTAAAVAIENRVEGCVRETFAALVAAWQATHAADADIARAMRSIARDEAEHAALAWSIDAWLSPRLDVADRMRIRRAARRAVRQLRKEAENPAPRALTTRAGLPRPGEALRLLASLDASLWSAF